MTRKPNGEASDADAPGVSPRFGPTGPRSARPVRGHINRIVVKLAATAGVLTACALLAGAATWSNLNATATNASNSFAAGTVTISTNSSGTAQLSLTNAKPGSTSTGCIEVN
jgi:hypothetical protein